MCPSQLALLRKYEIRPTKRRGQNFLIDGNLARRIAEDILALGSDVLELGAGGGALTGPLLAGGASVWAVEVDRRLCSLLEAEFGGQERFRLLAGDLTALNLGGLLQRLGERPVVAGNLPYLLTSTVLFALAELRAQLGGAVVMIQREVAARLTAEVGTKDYGILAAVLGSLFSIEAKRQVPATVFWPRPEVDSTVVSLVPSASWSDSEYVCFRDTVKALFGQRRKKVATILRTSFSLDRSDISRVADEAAFDPDKRPEQLTPQELRSLARAVGGRKNE
ncbi:MAG: 16S rRNA (adenine(1518)-N(6)/adenine(1519)-N(6))-dimethyltransferase RsmA [bacterium]